ncbi:metallophosphoesterase [Beduinella massiliensis]|uniref:metallophosphoesterase n=1 Tax=Beduinella massiliensis TaxID=1852363 RepID=UPI000C81C2A4
MRKKRGCLSRLIRKLVRFCVVLLLLCYPFIEPYLLRVEQKTLAFSELPQGFDGLRVAFLSDIHYGPFFSADRLDALVSRVNALRPDLVLLGGDYANDSDGAVAFFQMRPAFSARLGVYAVPGNHDRVMPESNRDLLEGAMSAAGIVPLFNRTVPLTLSSGETIYLSGIDDYGNGHPDAVQAARSVRRDDFLIFLTHNPDAIPSFQEIPALDGSTDWADLILCGHTHGGQVTLFGQKALFSVTSYGERYRTGWKEENGAQILISNGVGTSVVPMRFFAPPQIHLLTLTRQ